MREKLRSGLKFFDISRAVHICVDSKRFLRALDFKIVHQFQHGKARCDPCEKSGDAIELRPTRPPLQHPITDGRSERGRVFLRFDISRSEHVTKPVAAAVPAAFVFRPQMCMSCVTRGSVSRRAGPATCNLDHTPLSPFQCHLRRL